MKQIITTTLTIAKPLRLALFLITLLFLPSTAWGQDLISIAGTDVSSTNENITGDNISGKVSFIVAEGNNTLTLDGATINGSINYSGTDPLTIILSGSNIITATEDNRSAITINNSNASLKFKGQGAAKITPNNNKAITSTQSVQLDGVNVYSTEDYQLLTNIDNLTNGQSIIISAGAPTGLYIGGAIITTNILNALYNGKANFIPASEGGYATLQLDKAAITGDIEWDMNNALKIQLTEANTIQGCIHSNKDVALSFTYPSGATNSTLTFGNSEGTQSAISGFTEVTFPEINSQEINKLSFDENVSYNTSDKALKNDKNEVVTSSHISYYYGLTIAGVAVTSANAEDITGNNTVTFNASTNTLIINNATIDGYIEYNSSNPLIIEFSGANKIGYQNPGYLTSNVTTTLTLKKGVGNCSLSFFNSSTGLNYSSISGFSSVELDNGVYVQSSDYCSYRSGAFKYQDGTLVKSLTFTTTPYYPLWIAGVQVNEGNIQGDGITGTVTYNATNSTLTLNGATINGSIKSSLNDLTIEVAGSSNTLTAILYEGSSTSSTLLIKTSSSSSTVNKLTLQNSTGAVISGFSTVTLDGLYFLTPNYPSVTTSTDWTSSINEAIITNETLSAPTMSSETVDGVSTITLTSTADNSTIKYSIDYVDSEETDITDAIYDSSHKPTISKPATVTAKVTLNEVESATTTGKYFGTNPSPFTLISGTDPIDFDLAPAIVESDGISITSISGIESNVTYDAATRKISSSTMGSFNGQVSMSSTEGKTVILNNNFTATFNVQIDISQAVITLDNTELIYNGQEQTVSVQKVMVGDDVVPQDYYEVSGNTGTEIGNYSLTVTAKTRDSQGNLIYNNYTGTATKEWKITNHPTASASELGFNTETQTFSTYYNPNEDFNLPDGYVGYIIKGIEGSKVLTVRISYIPKGVAVLVEKGSSNENPVEEIPSEQPLKGTFEPLDVTSITGGTVYVLYNGMFVKSTSGTIPEKRCYLLIDTNVAAGTRGFIIDHGEGSTALRSVAAEGTHGKSDAWYTLQGRRLSAKPTKSGLYLRNGKKVVIK